MNEETLNSELLLSAAAVNSTHRDFDFLEGVWKVHNRKLKQRLVNYDDWQEFTADGVCRRILNGFGNSDSFFADAGDVKLEGFTLRIFDPKTKLWSIYWADTNNFTLGIPQIGHFDEAIGDFYAYDQFEGKRILVRFNWNATRPNEPVWSQAFSPDDGQSWEWNWYMRFLRQ